MRYGHLLKSPYVPHGRDPATGLDCYGVAICVLGMDGIRLPDVFYTDTKQETNAETMRILENGIPHERLEFPEKNAIVEIELCGVPSHIGVCIGEGLFIHATRNFGVAIEPLSRYKRHIRGYYRIKEAVEESNS